MWQDSIIYVKSRKKLNYLIPESRILQKLMLKRTFFFLFFFFSFFLCLSAMTIMSISSQVASLHVPRAYDFWSCYGVSDGSAFQPFKCFKFHPRSLWI